MRYDLFQDDLEPALQMDLVGSSGLPGGSTVQFVMAQADGPKRVTGSAVIDNPGSSSVPPTVHYQWVDGDTNTPGVYRAVWRALLGGGAPETFPSDEPLYVIIHPKL